MSAAGLPASFTLPAAVAAAELLLLQLPPAAAEAVTVIVSPAVTETREGAASGVVSSASVGTVASVAGVVSCVCVAVISGSTSTAKAGMGSMENIMHRHSSIAKILFVMIFFLLSGNLMVGQSCVTVRAAGFSGLTARVGFSLSGGGFVWARTVSMVKISSSTLWKVASFPPAGHRRRPCQL